MKELILNKKNRSIRKWSWTNRNKSRADDILSVMRELRKWWPMTARLVYYRLISSNAIKKYHWYWKNERVDIYRALVRTLKWMRIDDMIPWESITDMQRKTTPKIGFSNPSEFIGQELDDFLTGYGRCMAQKQENYIEVWIEKEALLHIIKPVADKFCRRVTACRGYNSITFQTQFYDRAREALNAGQTPVVLYFGDWDPSGVNMIFAAMQTLTEELDLYKVKYYRAGINPEHFAMIPADPVPIKSKDSRSRRFVEQHGFTAYELDAFHPNQLQQLVRENIEAFTDMTEFNENAKKEKFDLDTLEELKDDVDDYVTQKIFEIGL